MGTGRRKKFCELSDLFYRGAHQEVLDRTVDRLDPTYKSSELHFVVGALTFLGRQDEASLLFEQALPKLNRDEACVSRFFLGVALCRHSQYEKSLACFIENLRELRRDRSLTSQTYAYQGVAFYRYFCGRYHNALRAGRKAFESAIRSGCLYGKFLASDLMGHALIQTGEVSAGLERLREALRCSKALGDGEADESVQISMACYHAAFGMEPETEVATLERLAHKVSPQDNYSRSSLLLEIARQYSLRGSYTASQNALNQACRLIYSSGNRRHGVLLNLRYAQNLFLKGEYHQALSLIRSTSKELDPRVDKALQLQVYGMELKLKRALGFEETNDQDPLNRSLLRLTRYTGLGIGRRIARRALGSEGRFSRGEDPLGDLIDRAQEGSEAIDAILSSGYLSLLYGRMPLSPGDCVLFFDLMPESVLIADRGDLTFVPKGISQVLKALAKNLAEGECSKQKLIERVWGYRYDRLRHDALIYQAISRFRQLLGERGQWVEATERGYRFARGVNVQFKHKLSEVKAVGEVEKVFSQHESLLGKLNHRQLLALTRFRDAEFFDVQSYKNAFRVSQITATRDLSQLYQLSLIKRVGKGRATRYFNRGGIDDKL